MLAEFWKGHRKKEEDAHKEEETPASGERSLEDAKAEHRERMGAVERAAREAPLPVEARLGMVMRVRAIIREASDMKRLARAAEDRGERMRYAQRYQELRDRLEALREAPEAADVELAWRQFVEFKARFKQFTQLTERARALKLAIRQKEIVAGATAQEVGVGVKGAAETRRLAAVARAQERQPMPAGMELDEETMRELFGDEAVAIAQALPDDAFAGLIYRSVEEAEGTAMIAVLEGKTPEEPEASIAELTRELEWVQEQRQERWDDPMVRWLWYEAKRKELRTQLQEGREVVNLPSTERLLAQVGRHEEEDPLSLFGSVLVGPPGTGKTTAVREHCRREGRKLVEIDLSGDVTRYLFWGTKELVHEDPVERYEQLKKRVVDLRGEELVDFIKQGIAQYGPSFLGVAEEAANALGEVDQNTALQFREALKETLEAQFQKQLATEVYKYGRENGWRAGLVMHALQNQHSILFNEFNKAKDLSFLHGLLTAKAATNEAAGTDPKQERPGWFFVADAKQWVRLGTVTAADGTERAASKMYFTANVGKQYKVSSVLGPLASRAEGRVIQVDYVPKEEEVSLTAALVEDGAGRPMIDNDASNKFVWLIGEVFPKIRAFIEDKPQSIPLSFRTIRNLVAKLVDRKTEHTRPGASVDRAATEVLVDTYNLYPDQTIPAQIARELITQHIVTDRAIIKEYVRSGLLPESEVEFLLGEGEVFAADHAKDTLHGFIDEQHQKLVSEGGEMPEA